MRTYQLTALTTAVLLVLGIVSFAAKLNAQSNLGLDQRDLSQRLQEGFKLGPLEGSFSHLAPAPVVVQEPISIPALVKITAQPAMMSGDEAKKARVARLRDDISWHEHEVRYLNWTLISEALAVLVVHDVPDSPPEDEVREVREHVLAIAEDMRELEALTGEQAEAERRYQARIHNLQVFPNGRYSVETSDSTVITRFYPTEVQAAPAAAKGQHVEFKCDYVQKPVSAGFDQNNVPQYRMGMDVECKNVTVPD